MFRCHLQAKLPAGFRLAVECLGDGSWTANLAQQQDFYLKLAALVSYSQHVSNPDLARRLGRLIVGLNPAQRTGSAGQGSRFEKTCGPKPFIDSYAGHLIER